MPDWLVVEQILISLVSIHSKISYALFGHNSDILGRYENVKHNAMTQCKLLADFIHNINMLVHYIKLVS